MPSKSLLSAVCLCLLAVGSARAQSYADRTLSIQPPPPGPVIVSPVKPGAPVPSSSPTTPASSGTIGSYASDAPGADLRARDTDYQTVFPIVHRLPVGATIRDVRWRYGVDSKPPGFEATLCWKDAATCWVVTEASQGSTSFFQGRDATQGFLLIYRVRGKGALAPIKGAMNQVIVSFDVPR